MKTNWKHYLKFVVRVGVGLGICTADFILIFGITLRSRNLVAAGYSTSSVDKVGAFIFKVFYGIIPAPYIDNVGFPADLFCSIVGVGWACLLYLLIKTYLAKRAKKKIHVAGTCVGRGFE
jgi:hypothetical protein